MTATMVVRGRLDLGVAPVEVSIHGGQIHAVGPMADRPGVRVVGDTESLLAAGFLDIQVNGFGGIDFNRPTLTTEELATAMRAMWRYGVTQFFPTVITAPLPAMQKTLKAIARARAEDPALARAIPGVHLEGPFLSPEDGPRGAHPLAYVRDPDWDLFRRLREASEDLIRLVTLAPERPGAIEMIRRLRQASLIVAVGHTDATEADIDQAVAAGAQLSSHLGNGAHAVLPRHRNYIQKQLATDALMASLIADGHHLPDYVVKNMIRCKGSGRIILITDAMAAASAPPGTYRLGEVLAEACSDGCVRLPGTPYLAGSTLTMDRAVENAAHFAGLPLVDTIRMATRQPRQLFSELEGGITPGKPADLVLLRTGPPLTVMATIVGGEILYSRT
jgi:N-acetylglucosamine-6-phosphate deacetylase